LIGPGISNHQKSLSLIKNILKNYKGKCVVDATALNSINYKKINLVIHHNHHIDTTL